jgi:hypothetical protein
MAEDWLRHIGNGANDDLVANVPRSRQQVRNATANVLVCRPVHVSRTEEEIYSRVKRGTDEARFGDRSDADGANFQRCAEFQAICQAKLF